jgi:hypothetical protein
MTRRADGWKCEPESQGAVPRVRKLLVVVVHRKSHLGGRGEGWFRLVPLDGGGVAAGWTHISLLAALSGWAGNGRGTPDASINGGESATKSSAAELLGDVVCYVRDVGVPSFG